MAKTSVCPGIDPNLPTATARYVARGDLENVRNPLY